MALNDLTGPSAGPLARIPYFIHSFPAQRFHQVSLPDGLVSVLLVVSPSHVFPLTSFWTLLCNSLGSPNELDAILSNLGSLSDNASGSSAESLVSAGELFSALDAPSIHGWFHCALEYVLELFRHREVLAHT